MFTLKTMPCTAILTLAFMLGITAQAVPINAARIDVDGMKPDIIYLVPGETQGGTAENKPGGEWKNTAIRTSFPADTNWKQGSFCFTPDKDGAVSIHVMGQWARNDADRSWVLFDGIQVNGAELKNGDFENDIQGWWKPAKKGASVVNKAKSGSNAVKVNHDNGLMQKIKVKGGQQVTITFWYKLAH